jgi:hypothetical protein
MVGNAQLPSHLIGVRHADRQDISFGMAANLSTGYAILIVRGMDYEVVYQEVPVKTQVPLDKFFGIFRHFFASLIISAVQYGLLQERQTIRCKPSSSPLS